MRCGSSSRLSSASRPNSTVANLDARSDLEEAERLIAAGDRDEAKDYLDQAADHADDVIDSSQHDALVAWLERLQQQLDR